MTPSDVRHNEAENRFEAEVNGQLAVAEYERTGDTIRFFHTQVPQEFQGRGIGESMAKAALDYSRDNELHVVPLCQFIDAYMRKHPEYAGLRQKKKTQE
ncbi:MAG TPA: GNAT family N-acetyltransferase [Gemmatimonadaceae bacterium]|nr:GNAT family N-acetyltransferase [Gemmatimonadaceae bacterium]